MCKDYINIRLFQSLQTTLQTLDNMFPAQAPRVWLLASSAKEHLGNKDIFVSWPSQLLERGAHLNLALAIGIHLRSVKSIDAIFPCCLQAVFHDIALLGAAIGEPATW